MSGETREDLLKRRQAFFESEVIDQLVTMILEVAAEQWVLRERLFVMEKAAENLGLKLPTAVENYHLSEQEQEHLAAMRKTMIDNLMRSVDLEHRRVPPMPVK